MTLNPKSILIYSGAERVGDGIYKLPFVSHLRHSFPDAWITWVAGKGHTVYAKELAPLVTPLINEVLDEADIGRHWSEMLGPPPLDGRCFDLVIDTGRVFRTTLIVRRIPHHYFISSAAGYVLSDFRPTPLRKSFSKAPSVAGLLREMSELVTGKPMPDTIDLELDQDTLDEAARLLPEGGKDYVGFAPGSNDLAKCWPLDHYIKVAHWVEEQGKCPVFLLGPNETHWAETIGKAVTTALLPLQNASEVTPWLTIALGRRLKAAVVNDCGAAHMLAAANTPLVALFGPTRPEKFAPNTKTLEIIKAQTWNASEMSAIPIDPVIAALKKIMATPI